MPEEDYIKSTTSIVKDATGYAKPGSTLYIMGSSGAGKTSLLNMLSDRIKKNGNTSQTGKVLINDKIEMTSDIFGKVGAYVMQDDVLFSHFTPREALTFAARLKLKDNRFNQEKRVS